MPGFAERATAPKESSSDKDRPFVVVLTLFAALVVSVAAEWVTAAEDGRAGMFP